VGSPQRLDFTAIGDTVNTAARIEAENKALRTQILISAATYDALPEEERLRLGCASLATAITVKGKQEELHLYPVEVVDADDLNVPGAKEKADASHPKRVHKS